jgi:polysaccharide export outer membrane protein
MILVITLVVAVMTMGEAQQNAIPRPGVTIEQVSSTPPSPLPNSTPDANASGFNERYPRYRIGPGDSFEVKFEYNAQFDQTVNVQPDGYISLNGAGDIHVGGKTVPETAQAIRSAYGRIFKDPSTISVVLKDFEKPYFIADGQVQRPGRYELRGDITVTEAIALAGGFQSSAKHSRVVLYRRVSNLWMKGQVLNVKHMHAERDLHEDLYLHSGDMVFVPKNSISKIQPWLPIPHSSIMLSPQTF